MDNESPGCPMVPGFCFIHACPVETIAILLMTSTRSRYSSKVRLDLPIQEVDPTAKFEVLLKDRLVQVESAETPGAIASKITSAGYPATQAPQI